MDVSDLMAVGSVSRWQSLAKRPVGVECGGCWSFRVLSLPCDRRGIVGMTIVTSSSQEPAKEFRKTPRPVGEVPIM